MLSRNENPWVIVGAMSAGFLFMLLLLMSLFGGLILAFAVIVSLPIFAVFLAMQFRSERQNAEVMNAGTAKAVERLHTPRSDWLPRSILSGFIASTAMLATFFIAYGVALAFSSGGMEQQSGTASQNAMTLWLYNLTHNAITDIGQASLYFAMGAHLATSLIMAALYAYLFEPRVGGADWTKGVYFSVLPWFLSVTIFFPLVGGGVFGVELGAGPLPYLGNLVLHLVFGATLGLMYGPLGDTLPGIEETQSAENQTAMRHAEKAAAIGIVGGMFLGLALAIGEHLALQPDSAIGQPASLAAILGLTLIGGALGSLVGTLVGLPGQGQTTNK